MKILMINKFYYGRGGSESYTFSLTRLLKSKNHLVIPFSMKDEKNHPSEYSKYFVENIDYSDSLNNFGFITGLKVAYRSIYSTNAKHKLEILINEIKPDVAHLHNIHYQLTPSIIRVLKKHSIPIVWTLHDYTLMCPNSTFLSNNKTCEKCKKRKYYQAILNKCKKGSLSASLLASIDSYLNTIFKTYQSVDAFITPSRFLKDKLIEYGYNPKKVYNIPNFVEEDFSNNNDGVRSNQIIFMGRLSPEKGIETLINAIKDIDSIELVIVGDGPLRSSLEKRAKEISANVKFTGHLPGDEVSKYLSQSNFVVVPSECYENFPYSVLEALMAGKPVIASRTGGIPEQIEDGVTGLLFEPRDKEDLRQKISYLLSKPAETRKMGANAKAVIQNKYDPEQHYKMISRLYEKVIESESKNAS